VSLTVSLSLSICTMVLSVLTLLSLHSWLGSFIYQVAVLILNVLLLPLWKANIGIISCHESDLHHQRSIVLQSKKQRQQIQLAYDPLNCTSLHHFQPLKNKSDCIFAKSAVLWGSPQYDVKMPLETNISYCVDSITKFMSIAESTNVDGYLIEVVGEQYGNSVDAFAVTVRKVLQVISRSDPSGLSCIDMPSINKPSWYFSFGGVPVFVTSFAPCYTPSHCRYMHHNGSSGKKDRCFILLQPEASFLRRGIDADSPHTNWLNPTTPRDMIRCQFKRNGREYHVPETTSYAVAASYVLPMNCIRGNGISFWDRTRYPDSLNDGEGGQ
jgi:hypothetical protein